MSDFRHARAHAPDGADPLAAVASTGRYADLLDAPAVPAIRAGSVAVSIEDGMSYSVVFGCALPDANYAIALSGNVALAAAASWADKTADGFTLKLPAAIAGVVDWTAIAHT